MNRLLRVLLLSVFVGTALAQQYGAWMYEERIDPITDTNTSTILSYANVYGEQKRTAAQALVLRCSLEDSFLWDGVEVFFIPPKNFGEPSPTVIHRVDNNPPVEASWTLSTTGTSLFAPTHKVKNLLYELSHGSEFVIRLSDNEATEWTFSISLEGFRAALETQDCYDRSARQLEMLERLDLLNLTRHGSARLVREVIAAGAEIRKPNSSNISPLEMAILEGTPDTLQALIDAANIDINERLPRYSHRTPLMFAARIGRDGSDAPGRVRVLLDAGADIHTEILLSGSLITAYDIAVDNEYLQGTEELLRLKGE